MQHPDIAVLVLQLAQYQETNLMEQMLCGRKLPEWVNAAVAPFRHQTVMVSAQDDIMTLFKEHLTDAAYTIITYADMPLMTTDEMLQAVDYCQNKNVPALKLPRGWVFNTTLVAQSENFPITDFPAADPICYLVAYNNAQIAKIRSLLQERINERHLKNGINIIDPSRTYIDDTVQLATGVTIEPNVHLCGNTSVHENTTILDGSRLADAAIGKNCLIGPYAHIRKHCSIGNGCQIGNFVEIKRSRIGDNTKIAHMTYVGDSTIGNNCNIGCGVIFCNYNGKAKTNCLVGDHVFVGSNSCLVAPLEIGNKAYIAAGSVITEQLPDRALGIARARQAIKENYVTNDD